MGACLPIACFLLLLAFFRRGGLRGFAAVRLSALCWGVLIVAITESLSAFDCLTRTSVLVTWSTVDALLLLLALRQRAELATLTPEKAKLEPAERAMRVGIVTIVSLTAALSIASAPNNWDSMVYHLSRVMHWMSSRSVAVYPTNCLTQLYHQPWAEWVMLQFQILCDSDRLAFLVGWASMVGCIFGSADIARQLGADRRGQVIAAALVATLPSGVLQAESTQNSYPVAFWLICAISAILEARSGDSTPGARHMRTSLEIGAALGLAVLTKATAGVYCVPIVVWYVIRFRGHSIASTARILLLTSFAAALILAGHAISNFRWCGSLSMPAGEVHFYRVDALSARLLLANLLRVIALHFNTPLGAINIQLQHCFERMISLIGIAVDDPRITFPGHGFHLPLAGHEDGTGNPLHLLLVLVVAGMFLFSRELRLLQHARAAAAILFCSIVGFVGFAAMVKWQPNHARLHLAVFVIAAAPCAVALSMVRKKMLINLLILMSLAFAGALVIFNPLHALVGARSILIHSREQQYFIGRPELLADYQRAADLLKDSPDPIGIATSGSGWEYPLWVFIHDRAGRWPRIIATPASPAAPQPSTADLESISAIVVLDPVTLPATPDLHSPQWREYRLEHLIVWKRAPGSGQN